MNPTLGSEATMTTEPIESRHTTPNGPIWAGILAAGIGCAAFGSLVDLAEASKAVSKALNFYRPSGDLSGKTTVAVIVWLLTWAALGLAWRRREIRSGGVVLAVTVLLVLFSIVAVFPPFIELFSHR
jgi:hypothetical protein